MPPLVQAPDASFRWDVVLLALAAVALRVIAFDRVGVDPFDEGGAMDVREPVVIDKRLAPSPSVHLILGPCR